MKRKLTINEIKKISLDMLKEIDAFCDRNKITYYLSCGTLLGAIKYKGFIPWDDDVDIMMPRPDYEKFLNSFNSKKDNYKLIKPCTGRNYYAKIYDCKTIKYEDGVDYSKYKPLGVSVDVFPLDGIVNDELIINKLMKKSATLELLLRLSNQPIFYRRNPLKCINRILPRLIGSKNLVKMIENNAQTYKYEDSEYVIRMRNTPNGFTGALKKDVYNPPVKMKFENIYFCVPKDYDKWLKRFYGVNYMNELPPVEKRKPHHKCECYLIEG